MLEFQVNRYLSLKLEDSKTKIYVNGEFFIICKFLLIDISYSNHTSINELSSIDEIELEGYSRTKDERERLTPDIEFWGHCSNLQVWAENDYNTNLLHRNLAFPLLRKLSEVGDIKARAVLKEEIARRFSSGFKTVQLYLIEENYLDFLNRDELDSLIETVEHDRDLFNRVSQFKEKVFLFIHFKESSTDYVKFALSYTIQKLGGLNYVFGYFFSDSERFFVFSSEGSFQNLVITDDYNIWEKNYDVRKVVDWDSRYNITLKTIKSKKYLFDHLKISLKSFLRGDGDYYVIKEGFFNNFKKLGDLGDYVYISDGFKKEYLFFLSEYWILPFRYQSLKLE